VGAKSEPPATSSTRACSATLTAVLADGSITLQGASLGKRIPGASAPSQDVYAITGGTGAYVGVAGTMRRSGNGKTDTDVFELR
jgi:hypothetical protein